MASSKALILLLGFTSGGAPMANCSALAPRTLAFSYLVYFVFITQKTWCIFLVEILNKSCPYIDTGWESMVKPQILWGKPALMLGNALVIGDLHIGLEQELSSKGVHLPSLTNRMEAEILNLVKENHAKKLIILGDLKHKIASVSAQESREIPLFLSDLSKFVDITIVLGNHDGGLRPYLKQFRVFDMRGFVYRGQCLIHGSAKPNEKDLKRCEGIIASHWHPVVEFKDKLGGRVVEKAWVFCKALGEPLVIMPSFNKLLGGVPVNEIKENWVDLTNAEIYLLDGIPLGKMNPTNR